MISDVLPKLLMPEEKQKLAACEATIEKGLETFYEVGLSLLAVRDGRLFRETHKGFMEYCQDRWNFTNRRAWQLIEAAQLVVDMNKEAEIERTIVHLPKNEGQARELLKVDPKDRSKVMQKAHESTRGQPTAKDIAQAAEHLTGAQSALKGFNFAKRLESVDLKIQELVDHADHLDLECLASQLETRAAEIRELYNQKKSAA